MTRIFRYRKDQPVTWYDHRLPRSNQYCLYCSRFIGETSDVPSNKEHLIGKNFVPQGKFDNGRAFNFIFRACQKCNTEKSEIEDHVSAATLLTSSGRGEDERVDELALRKASSSFHPVQKGAKLADTKEAVNLDFGFLSFGLIAPPQLNKKYCNQLALRHVQGLFSLVTSVDPTSREGTRLLPPDQCWILGYYSRRDWGNPQLHEVVRRSENWPCYAIITTADGYFKAILRQEAPDKHWFWALEWNKSARIAGCIAAPGRVPDLFQDLPELDWRTSPIGDGGVQRYREETPLASDADTLFSAEVCSPS